MNTSNNITSDYMGRNGFVWFHGVVEDTNDPLKIGRVRVRCLEFHTDDKQLVPTEALPWAVVLMPNTSASVSGKGTSPSGLLQGSWVIGFFRDGLGAQDPVILGTFHGMPQPDIYSEKLSNPSYGFNDPLGIYPNEEYRDESDVNRLARGGDESFNYGCVPAKIEKAAIDVKTALGEETWSEPVTQYAPIYPHNKVMETESGHIVEFDDTKGAERIHIRHTSGTWVEIHPDGSMVTKVIGEQANINLNNKNSLVNGDENKNINGSQRIRIGKDGLVEIVGDAKILVNGNTVMQTKKDFVHKVDGNYSVAAGGKMLFVASRIDFNPEGVGPDSLSVNLPSSEETVAELEEISKKNEEATPYQVLEQTTESSSFSTNQISLGAVSGTQAFSTNSFSSPSENFVELSQNTLPQSVGGVGAENTNFVELPQNTQMQSVGTEIVDSSGTGLGNVQETQSASSPSLINSLGGVATVGVAIAAISAPLLVSSSSQTSSQQTYPQPISPVQVPAGSEPVQTNAPGIPTQTFYAIPGATATYIAGYPGVSGPALSTPGSTIGQVTSVPAVPLVGFETEFPTQGIQIVDGGEF
jgi:hypothetical protein